MTWMLIMALAILPQSLKIDWIWVRDQYALCESNAQKTKELYTYLKSTSSYSNTLLAYQGATETILAKHEWNPYDKLRLFNSGKTVLESALGKEPANIEIRFLRLSIQQSAPTFLNYYAQKEADKRFILENLSKIRDQDLKSRIVKFLILRCNLSKEEREMLP